MKTLILSLTAATLVLSALSSASAGPATGAAIGAGAGAVVAGPPGAVVGGVVGAVVGGPNIHYYHHHRLHTDSRGHSYFVTNRHRHYV